VISKGGPVAGDAAADPSPVADPFPGDAALAAWMAETAGALLLEVRAAGADGDRAELGRRGDRVANDWLLDQLARNRPQDAVLSEESPDDQVRLGSRRVWIIDPLDGTREFTMDAREDWAVHVALWEAGAEITAAAVSLPAAGEVFATDPVPAAPSVLARSRPLMLVSGSRPPAFAQTVADQIGADLAAMGSAGAKAMAVVRGDADAYLHSGGQWEWDSAAPVGVALAAGLHASRIDGAPLRYNQSHPYVPDLLVCRPQLADELLAALVPYR
jgi:3'(2'), 5'-bisphosphate nucleotidase